jgi:hypothetical protein
MLDFIGSLLGGAAIAVCLAAIAVALPGGLARKLVGAAGAGLWIGLSAYVAATGQLAVRPDQPVPLIAAFVFGPLAVFGLAWVLSGGFRSAMLALPMPLLIGLNVIRSLGFMFLALQAVGRLGGPFPVSAGVGDITTGALAIPVALLAARGSPRFGFVIAAWNAFGVLDLAAAVALGVVSANGSPIQLIFAGSGSEAVQHLPYSMIPTVLVPFFLMTHAVVAAHLARRGRVQAVVA